MKTVVSTLALGAALLLGSTSLTVALEAGKLTVWLGTNRDDAAVRTIAQKFTEDLGVVHGVGDTTSGWSGKQLEIIGRVPRSELRGCSDTHAYNRPAA